MGGFISFFKTTKGLLTLGFLTIALIAIPVTVYLVKQQQNLQQSAHVPQPSVTTACQGANVFITYSYTVANLPAGVTANVALTDTQNYVSDNFSWKNGDPTYTRSVNTNKASILAGILTFKTTATDGFSATNQVGYQATGPCTTPPTTTTTTVPPTTTTTTVPPTETLTETPTDTPTETPTTPPGSTATPTSTPVPGASSTPTPTVVQPTLAPTGPSSIVVNIGIFGILIALIGGILLLGL